MIEVHEDKVIIKNPGGFPEGMSADKLGKLSVRRNELIADIFARMHRVERMGSGFKRIRQFMDAEDPPFPKISSDSFFFIEFERPKKAAAGKKQGSVKSSVKIIELIRQDKNITIPAIAESLGLTTRAVEKQIANLQKKQNMSAASVPTKAGIGK